MLQDDRDRAKKKKTKKKGKKKGKKAGGNGGKGPETPSVLVGQPVVHVEALARPAEDAPVVLDAELVSLVAEGPRLLGHGRPLRPPGSLRIPAFSRSQPAP